MAMVLKILAVILIFCALTSAKPKLTNFRTGNQDPVEEIEGLLEDETKITEPFGSDATDELEEVVDNTATFGDGLNDHSGGGEGEEGSGVSPAGAGAGTGGPPPHIKLLIWIKKRCFRICVRLIPRHPFNQCVHHCVHLHLVHFYCKAHPWKCSKKTQADEKQEGIPFIEKESAQA